MTASSRVEDSNPTFSRHAVAPTSSSPPPPPRDNQDSAQRTTYNDHDDYRHAAPTTTIEGDDTSHARVGDNSTPPSSAAAAAAASTENGLGRAPKSSTMGEVGLQDSISAIVWTEFLRAHKNWILFVGGNLISAAVVVSEISLVDGCFDEPPPEESSDSTDSRAENSTAGSEADAGESIRSIVIALLLFGLVTELVSAAVLSFQYRSPLDIKSMRKVPLDSIRGCGAASLVVNLLAPFSWGVIYMCGSYVTIQVDTFASCGGGHEGSSLVMYLVVSGLSMFFVGLVLLGLTVLVFVSSCGSPVRCAENCCAAVRRAYRRRVLSIAALFDLFWQVQGSVWLYRAGAVAGAGLVVLIVFCVVGAVLAALGSREPDSTQELPGGDGAPPVALTEQPDATDGI